jgi:hypothetical protein
MTRVADRKTVMEAETSARYRGKPLMVTVGPHDVMIREYKRPRRLAVAVPWLAVYELGMKLAARERAQAKRGRHAGE